jgi:hypothetical protein
MTQASQNTAASGKPIREVRRSLARARDEQLARVVALVDNLQKRGAADDLLAPLRARIAELRPARPLNFSRLLFIPLDPLIVPAPRWEIASPSIPRTAIAPLASAVEAALGPAAEPVNAATASRLSDDTAAIAEASQLLWPAAAEVLKRIPIPHDWTAAGLPTSAYPQLVASIAFLLEHALTLQQLTDDAERDKRAALATIQTLLEVSSTVSPWTRAMLLALLLARLPQGELLREVLFRFTNLSSQGGRAVLDCAVNFVLEGLETRGGTEGPLAAVELSQAADEIARLTTLLNELATHHGATPDRRRRVEELRRSVNESCRRRFEKGLTRELIEPLRALPEDIDPMVITAFEDTARDLRRLEFAVRQVGDASHYDVLLRSTTRAIKEQIHSPTLTLADRVRLVELLAGPEEALAMLKAARAPSPLDLDL